MVSARCVLRHSCKSLQAAKPSSRIEDNDATNRREELVIEMILGIDLGEHQSIYPARAGKGLKKTAMTARLGGDDLECG